MIVVKVLLVLVALIVMLGILTFLALKADLQTIATVFLVIAVIAAFALVSVLLIGFAPAGSETELEKAYSLPLVSVQTVGVDDMYVIAINNNEHVFSENIPKENVVIINDNEVSPHLEVVKVHTYVLNIFGDRVREYTEEKYYLTIPANSIA